MIRINNGNQCAPIGGLIATNIFPSQVDSILRISKLVFAAKLRPYTPIFASLKVIVYILSAFLLLLSCYPCLQDKSDEHEEIALGISHDDEHSDSEGQDACTPFCMDSCCPTHLLCQINIPAIAAPFTADNVPLVFFSESSVKTVDCSIWQPPKLG